MSWDGGWVGGSLKSNYPRMVVPLFADYQQTKAQFSQFMCHILVSDDRMQVLSSIATKLRTYNYVSWI